MGCGASSDAYGAPPQTAARPKLAGPELLRSVRAYVESRAFAAPLSNWIDENCVTFTEDCLENPALAAANRAAHSQYISFTDQLLTAHLLTVGSTVTKFYRACRDHMGSPDVESSAIKAILSMVDFHCFQMMMVTRNAEPGCLSQAFKTTSWLPTRMVYSSLEWRAPFPRAPWATMAGAT